MTDAVVVGAGPNGLAAAIELARAGRSVKLIERADEVGGGARTAELTLPGFRHDICAAVLPLVAGSPFMRSIPNRGEHAESLDLIWPQVQAAHPLDDGTAVALRRSVAETAAGLEPEDGPAYIRLIGMLAEGWAALEPLVLGPPLKPSLPPNPRLAARFALAAARSARSLASSAFSGRRARALFAGMAAHSMQPLEAAGTAAFGLVLAVLGHACGWPVARGGSGAIAAALRVELEALGGEVETGRTVRSLRDGADLVGARAILLDVTPRQLLTLHGEGGTVRLPRWYRAALRGFRYGPGVFKVDYALSGPVPWTAPECRAAGTVHVGGTLEEIALSERTVGRGGHPQRPYVLVAQPSLIDRSRVPPGSPQTHTLWAYCHVPNGSGLDMTAAIEAQLERFAPGFSDLVLARAVRGPADYERYDPNYVGGDINGGAASLRQTLARPVPSLTPYATPDPRVLLCSASTPPGGGVHGMCGYNAARVALRRVLR